MVKLYDVLNNSYKKNPNEKIENYDLDKSLSNHNQQIYYSKKDNKLLMSVAGTHNIRDIGTDFKLGFGDLKNTSRYKEAEKVLKQAKDKYNPMSTTLAGHSLGSTITNYLGSSDDKVVGLNGGFTFGMSSRPNVTNYRTAFDRVSILGARNKNVKTLPLYDVRPFKSHSIDAIKNSGIEI